MTVSPTLKDAKYHALEQLLAHSRQIGAMKPSPELKPGFAVIQTIPPVLVQMPDGTMRRPEDVTKSLSELKPKTTRRGLNF